MWILSKNVTLWCDVLHENVKQYFFPLFNWTTLLTDIFLKLICTCPDCDSSHCVGSFWPKSGLCWHWALETKGDSGGGRRDHRQGRHLRLRIDPVGDDDAGNASSGNDGFQPGRGRWGQNNKKVIMVKVVRRWNSTFAFRLSSMDKASKLYWWQKYLFRISLFCLFFGGEALAEWDSSCQASANQVYLLACQ